MILKLKQHNTIENNLRDLVNIFNTVTLNATASQYAHGLPVAEIDTAKILRQHNYDKASALPNFAAYQNAGIDLSAAMPDCQVTKAALDELTALHNDYFNGQYKEELKGIVYDKKTKQFVVGEAGKAMLANAIVTLTKAEETAFLALFAAHKALLTISPKTARYFFSDSVANNLTTFDLRADDVIYYLRK